MSDALSLHMCSGFSFVLHAAALAVLLPGICCSIMYARVWVGKLAALESLKGEGGLVCLHQSPEETKQETKCIRTYISFS